MPSTRLWQQKNKTIFSFKISCHSAGHFFLPAISEVRFLCRFQKRYNEKQDTFQKSSHPSNARFLSSCFFPGKPCRRCGSLFYRQRRIVEGGLLVADRRGLFCIDCSHSRLHRLSL